MSTAFGFTYPGRIIAKALKLSPPPDRIARLERVAEAARDVELAWTFHSDEMTQEMLELIVVNAALKEEHGQD